jgi:hypothetical protein
MNLNIGKEQAQAKDNKIPMSLQKPRINNNMGDKLNALLLASEKSEKSGLGNVPKLKEIDNDLGEELKDEENKEFLQAVAKKRSITSFSPYFLENVAYQKSMHSQNLSPAKLVPFDYQPIYPCSFSRYPTMSSPSCQIPNSRLQPSYLSDYERIMCSRSLPRALFWPF